jgi:hypothetical protein
VLDAVKPYPPQPVCYGRVSTQVQYVVRVCPCVPDWSIQGAGRGIVASQIMSYELEDVLWVTVL